MTNFYNEDLGVKYFYDGSDPNRFATYIKNFNDAGGASPLQDIRIDGTVQEISQFQFQFTQERQVRFEQNLGQRTNSPFIAVRARRENFVLQSFIEGDSNYSSNNSGSGLYDYLKDTGFKDADKKYVGKLMHMYVNAEYISSTLDKNVNDEGELSLYDFLSNLMKGIQSATGNINSFEVIYNEDENLFKIIDNTFIPGLAAPSKSIVQFNANVLKNNYGSFIQSVNFKTKLSNNFATMTTVGAQKNGNVVGSNSTALSKWNVGLEDRIITERSNPNGVGTETVENAYLQNISRLVNFNNSVNTLATTEEDISRIKGAMSDIFRSEMGEFTNGGLIPGIGFIPFDLELTMLGLSGPRIYESYTIDTTLLPDVYKNKIQFICSGVSHQVNENGWITTLNSICGPKYDDVVISNPPNVDNYTSINQNGEGGGNGGEIPYGVFAGDSRLNPIKSVIFYGESSTYDALYPSTTYTAVYGVSAMTKTIQEIIDEGRTRVTTGYNGTVYGSSAVGRYQNLTRYIEDRASRAGLQLTDLYNEVNQEKMGEVLIDGACGDYVKGTNEGSQSQLEAAVQALAQEFASKPVINRTANATGNFGNVITGLGNVGYYGGDGQNPNIVDVNVSQVVKGLIDTRKNFVDVNITGRGGLPTFIPSYYQ